MTKYKLATISGIHVQIATDLGRGYTKGVMEIFFPDESSKMSVRKQKKWTKENNERMEAICYFLNNTYKK